MPKIHQSVYILKKLQAILRCGYVKKVNMLDNLKKNAIFAQKKNFFEPALYSFINLAEKSGAVKG